MKNYLFILTFIFSLNLYGEMKAILKVDPQAHSSLVRDIIVTKDKDIITASDDKTIRIYDKNGNFKRKILGFIGPGTQGAIYAIALSSDEKYLATAGLFPGTDFDVGKIRIYNYKTGKIIHNLIGHKDSVFDLSFSKDDKFLISGGSDLSAIIWDVKNNFKKYDQIYGHTNHIYATRIIKKDYKYYAITASWDNYISMYDLDEKKTIKSYKAKNKLQFLSINEQQHHIATNGYDKTLLIFDFNLNLIKKIKTKSTSLGIKYNENGTMLISGVWIKPYNVNIYDVENDYKIISSFKKHNSLTMGVNFIDNNTAISSGGYNNDIYIWDINSTSVINKIQSDGNNIWNIGLNQDVIAWKDTKITNKQLKSYKKTFNKYINIQNFQIYKNNNNLSFNNLSAKNGIYSLDVSRGNKHAYYNDGILNIRKNGNIIANIERTSNNGYRHTFFGWYKDYIISSGATGKIEIYTKYGKKFSSLIGHTGIVWAMGLDKDILITSGSDQIIKLWNLKLIEQNLQYDEEYIQKVQRKLASKGIKLTRKQVIIQALQQKVPIFLPTKIYPMLNIFISKNNEYIAWTNEGFFTSSKNATKYIGYHINNGKDKEAHYISVESLFNSFYRPDLIQKVLEDVNIRKYSEKINISNLLKNGLAPNVKILSNTEATSTAEINLKLEVCPIDDGGYDNLTLLLNNMPISITNKTRALKIKRNIEQNGCFIFDKTISLIDGKNKIGFKATNKSGDIESNIDTIEVTYNQTKKYKKNLLVESVDDKAINNLHILTIAVNKYQNKEFELKYSINDASEILKTISSVAKPLFKNIYTYKLFDEDVTKKNINKIFNTIKSTRKDVFLLYIAGHGITDSYNGKYYFIPFDYKNLGEENELQNQGVSQKDFMYGLSQVTALKSLVLLDTCYSGSFVDNYLQKTTTNKFAKATGRATISASSKTQVAHEGYNNHGVFTYTLLEALRGKAYYNDDKITVNELSNYVEDILPQRTYKKWGYKQIPQSSMYGTNFNLGVK